MNQQQIKYARERLKVILIVLGFFLLLGYLFMMAVSPPIASAIYSFCSLYLLVNLDKVLKT